MRSFNHAPASGATGTDHGNCSPVIAFQYTPERGRPLIGLWQSLARRVSIHAPARGATPRLSSAPCAVPTLSNRPHGGRRYHRRLNTSPGKLFQSTPARPARPGDMATRLVARRFNRFPIHAPARGATHSDVHVIAGVFAFNPHARTGAPSGKRYNDESSSFKFQSSAPARGAAGFSGYGSESQVPPAQFNPAPARGRRGRSS